ncbi:MAG: dTDP-4-dehydrorhamnose reductase [Spirochaetota bacterium]
MIWLIGSKGMLGTDVELKLKANGLEYTASDMDVDITDIEALRNFAKDKEIGWIINCSAYTAVDKAEDEEARAFKINADGVGNIAQVAKEKKAKLVHLSTDYVYDGKKYEAYLESDPTGPIGVYGKSKLKGEEKVLATVQEYFIFRISWLYGHHGANFVHTMLRLFAERDEVRVVRDQWGSPTFAKDVADLIIKVIKDNSSEYGIYHFTNSGRTNWYQFTLEIFNQAKERGLLKKEVNIIPITTAGYPTKARRPEYSYMSKDKVKKTFGVTLRPWQESLQEFIKIKAKNNIFNLN